MQIIQAIIKFPEINLQTRDAHKLRGYFGNVFKEHSPLLHNHFEDGKNRYAYPLVQYKVIKNIQLQNNILSFYKGIGFFTEKRIMVTGRFNEKSTKFKDQNMLAFSGTFVANAVLPDYVGLGKAVSRGFGTVNKNNNNNI